MYCRYCGKEIPNDSIFCPNCGKRQEGEPSKIDFQFLQGLKKYKKWGIIYIIWCLIHIGLLLCSEPKGQRYSFDYIGPRRRAQLVSYDLSGAFYPFDVPLGNVLQWKNFRFDPIKNVDVYDSSELFFYTILFPFMVLGIVILCRKYDLSIKRLKTLIKKKKIANNKNVSYIMLAVGVSGILILGAIAIGKTIKPIEPATSIDADSIEHAGREKITAFEEEIPTKNEATVCPPPLDTDSIEAIDSVEPIDDFDEDVILDVVFSTGDTPYSQYYGGNMVCRQSECSGVKVTAPETSDVVVIIKKNNKNGKVAGHAYISAGDTYKINLANGTYQTFFYYGEGWSPYKDMGNGIKGGFVNYEVFSKDNPQKIHNAVLTYVLQLRRDGNFHTESSNRGELF